MIEGRGLGPHLLDLVLCKETAAQFRRAGHPARERLEPTGEQPGEGGLAVAVGAEERDAVVRIKPQIEAGENRFPWGVAGADPVERDQWRAERGRKSVV